MLGIVAVFIGGGLGSVLRYIVNVCYLKSCSLTFPFQTLAINVIGSFILGFLIYYINARSNFDHNLRLMLTVGFCGGLTTFSTFSCEVIDLFNRNRFVEAILYIFATLLICLFGALLGAYFAKCI